MTWQRKQKILTMATRHLKPWAQADGYFRKSEPLLNLLDNTVLLYNLTCQFSHLAITG